MTAVESGTQLILKHDAGTIEPAAARRPKTRRSRRKCRAHKARVPVGGSKRHRTNRNRSARGPQKYAAARDDIIRTHVPNSRVPLKRVMLASKLAPTTKRFSCPNNWSLLVACDVAAVAITGRCPVDLAEYGVRRKGIDELNAVQTESGGRLHCQSKERWIGEAGWASVGLPSTIFCWNAAGAPYHRWSRSALLHFAGQFG